MYWEESDMNTNGKSSLAPPYPGIPTTTDGSGTVSWVETQYHAGRLRLSYHVLHRDGGELRPGRRQRRDEPVG